VIAATVFYQPVVFVGRCPDIIRTHFQPFFYGLCSLCRHEGYTVIAVLGILSPYSDYCRSGFQIYIFKGKGEGFVDAQPGGCQEEDERTAFGIDMLENGADSVDIEVFLDGSDISFGKPATDELFIFYGEFPAVITEKAGYTVECLAGG